MQWLLAVVTASLLGSLHCVGMCGPFVLIATQSTGNAKGSGKFLPLIAYHFGRLSTYLLLGLLIGSIASASEGLAGRWGFGHAVSIAVGSVMILLGLSRLWRLLNPPSAARPHSALFSKWNERIVKVRRRIRTENHTANAYVWGLLSTWLPCGWLYIFALASATAGSLFASATMMGAFWLGTLPALSIVAWGGRWFGKLSPIAMQWIAATLLIGFGLWTLASRASIDLSSLAKFPGVQSTRQGSLDTSRIEALREVELPCCSEDSSDGGKR